MGLLKCYPSSKDRIYWAQLLSKSIQDQFDQYLIRHEAMTSLLFHVITITTSLYWQNNRHSVLEWEMRTGPGTALVSKCCWDLCWSHNTTANTAQGIIIVNQMVIKLLQIASFSSSSSFIYLWFDIKTFLYNSSYISSLAGINLADDANWRAEAGGILFNLIDFQIALSLNRV